MTRATVSVSPLARLRADAVVVGVTRGPHGPALAPGAEALVEAFDGSPAAVLGALGMTGAEGEVAKLVAPRGIEAGLLLAVGLGDCDPDDCDPDDRAPDDRAPDGCAAEVLRRAAGVAARSLAGVGKAVLALPVGTAEAAEAVALGGLLGAYAFTAYRTGDRGKPPVGELVLPTTPERRADTDAAVRRATVVAQEVNRSRDLVNMPANDLCPDTFAATVRAVGEQHGLRVEVLDETALAEGGFGGILGVGRGSANPPRLVRVAHVHPGAMTGLALVGKGITYDSGGISLKPVGANEIMKRDMSGAAAVFAAVVAVSRLGLPVNVTGWLALAENMPSGSALRPGDVLRMYGGKTVEVLNTDAEGRLVLADAIVRATEEEPDFLVDVATLTAAMRMALGDRVFGVMSDDDHFRARVLDAAGQAGEQAWPMPLPAHLRKGLDSPIADIANTGERMGGGLTAALFLREFVPKGTAWAHLDIAGPAFHEGEPHGYTPRGGTGSAVRTLVRLAEDIAATTTPAGSETRPMTPVAQVIAPAAPTPFGHYAQATTTPDGTVHVSAQLPVGGGVTPGSPVAEQARQALANVVTIVESAGGSARSIAKVTLYVVDIAEWDAVDAVFAEVFGEHRPARAVLQVAGLHHGFGVAADAVAWRTR
ncbi:leucyl aminopeptidase [Saccharothrix variisporea]|uniref:Probable cytosol aminopeptidase n=1 Tax=Saccharothrix variisporea TaxID=543527 RepID=A0A495X1P7_9PSEU|nr:leucyl aminopeptidase [Saccharothrix variisporea]